MSIDTKTRITTLEFDDIRADIKQYLSSQAEFTDHNFDASGLSVILDILAYNSHYQALLANYAVNELFIDTAAKRSSIVSRAKELGYVPISMTAARAKLNIVVTNVPGNPSSLIIPTGTQFTVSINDEDYTFNTITVYDSVVETGSPNTYTFSDVMIYEGTYTRNIYSYDRLNPLLTIPNENIDINTLSVFVRENYSDGYLEYSRVSSFLSLDGTSKVYYLQEGYDSKYQIYFGDGVVGYNPIDTSSVQINYVTCNGSDANNGNTFSFYSEPAGWAGSDIVISTIEQSSGGEDRESELSIKHNALNFYGIQNRAVVAKDYSMLVKAFPAVRTKSVVAWGGEDNVPPKFNTVFLSVVPQEGEILIPSDQELIVDYLKTKAVANMNFEFVDPEYIDLKVTTVITYDKRLLDIAVGVLESDTKSVIYDYVTTTLNPSLFEGVFRKSSLLTTIDKSAAAIISNTTNLSLIKEVTPNFYHEDQIKFTFSNELNQDYKAPAVISSGFYVGDINNIMYLEDDKSGSLRLVYYYDEEKVIENAAAGTIDYITGAIYVNPILISKTVLDKLYFYATVKEDDISFGQNIIPRIRELNISVQSRTAS